MCHVQPTYVFVQPLERWRLFQVSADPKQTKNFHQESISLTQTAHSKGESPVTTGAGGHCRAAGGGGGASSGGVLCARTARGSPHTCRPAGRGREAGVRQVSRPGSRVGILGADGVSPPRPRSGLRKCAPFPVDCREQFQSELRGGANWEVRSSKVGIQDEGLAAY